jgi:hypothetical protein
MSSLSIPPELNQPFPRRVRTNGWFKVTVVVFSIFPAVGLLLLGIIYGISHDRAVLRANGAPTMGQVTDLQVEHGRDKSAYYRVSYKFQTPIEAQWSALMPNGLPNIHSGSDGVSEGRYRDLQIGQAVPILYDPARPSNSGLNFSDSVNASDDTTVMLLFMVGIVVLFGGIYIVFMAVLLFPLFKERKLVQWGHVARAVIIKEEQIGGGRPSMTATYQFTDAQGRTVTGVQKNLPSEKKLNWPGFREFLQGVMENPVVLYDPGNSEKNMLYRAGFLVCYLP